MDEIGENKGDIRERIASWFEGLSEDEIGEARKNITERLFGFANFVESNIVLFYNHRNVGIPSTDLIRESLQTGKIVVLPKFGKESQKVKMYKLDKLDDLLEGPNGFEPDPGKCKEVPIECIDIAIIPAVALDEKGGRLGEGRGRYDRLIPKLPVTTRKVSLAHEGQILPQVPMEPYDKYTDIIITEKRVIYKI